MGVLPTLKLALQILELARGNNDLVLALSAWLCNIHKEPSNDTSADSCLVPASKTLLPLMKSIRKK